MLNVVLLNWNKPHQTHSSIDRLVQWELPLHLIVVDNGIHSFSESREWLNKKHVVISHIASSTNMGFSGGNNLAFRKILTASESEFSNSPILLLNTDAQIFEGDCRILIDSVERNKNIAIAGPAMVESNKTYFGGRDIVRNVVTRNPIAPKTIDRTLIDVKYVPGAVAVINPKALREVGLFDEDYFFSGEVADWCARANLAGWRCVILPHCTAQHEIHADDPNRDSLYQYYSLRNRFTYIHKHKPFPVFYWKMIWIMRSLKMVIGAILRFQSLRRRALAQALLDGLRHKAGQAPSNLYVHS